MFDTMHIMATQLDEFDFSRTGRAKYPWNDWMNGRPWKVGKSDFPNSTAEGFRSTLTNKATAAGRTVKTQRVEEDGEVFIVFQFKTTSI